MMDEQGIPFLSAYGPAMCFIDRVIAFDPLAATISAQCTYSGSTEMIVAHSLAAGAIVPGIFLIEQAAQTALAFTLLNAWAQPMHRVRLVNVRAEWVQPAPLDYPITADVLVRPAGAGTSSFSAKLRAGETPVARVRGLVTFGNAIDA